MNMPVAWWRLSTLPECRPCVTTCAEEAQRWRDEGHDVRELGAVETLRLRPLLLMAAERQKQPELASIVPIESRMPHVVLPTSRGATVLPLANLQDIAEGRAAPSVLGDDELRTIIAEWLQTLDR